MRRILGYVLTTMIGLAGALSVVAQSTPQPAAEKSAASAARGEAPASAIPTPDGRTEKQKALAAQAERLCDMAAELKVQVDKTNKNILSLTVVQKAEAIEVLAKGMRGQAKR